MSASLNFDGKVAWVSERFARCEMRTEKVSAQDFTIEYSKTESLKPSISVKKGASFFARGPLYPSFATAPNHLHSYVPHAQTTSIYHDSPPQPCSEAPKDCTNPHCASYLSATPRTSISPSSNRFKLNPAKTEIIWLGSACKLKHCPMDELSIAGVMLRPTTQVRDLGVQLDSNLSMSTHINHLTRTCFYHIRQLRTVRRSLTVDTTHALVRALVHSRLDYCNSVLAGQPKYCFDKLQSVLRASARLIVLRLPGSSNVGNLIRRQLHWLPFPERVQFKL